MQMHANAKLGPAGRLQLVRTIEQGSTLRAAAAALNVAPATAHRWWRRWHAATVEERLTRACLADRSSRPHSSPRLLPASAQREICVLRERTGWGPRLIAGALARPHSTVSKALQRHGLSRPARSVREPARRYEWPCPGDLLHMDTKRYARFTRPGHAVTGDRRHTSAERRLELGYDFAHSVVDDHSRFAYAELHRDERAETVTGFLGRALEAFAPTACACGG